jgi:hypothetical protein
MSTLVGISASKWPKGEFQPSHFDHFTLHILHIRMHIVRISSIGPARKLCHGTEVSRSRTEGTVTQTILTSGYAGGTSHLEETKLHLRQPHNLLEAWLVFLRKPAYGVEGRRL